MSISNYTQVLEFTNAVRLAKGLPACPIIPQPMSKAEVCFLVGMVFSEMSELIDTVTDSAEETTEIMKAAIKIDRHEHKKITDPVELIAAQADALVDDIYYKYDAACKKGMNISTVFDLVHQANMRKLVDGKVILREDGKVMKPQGWQEADIKGYFQNIINS